MMFVAVGIVSCIHHWFPILKETNLQDLASSSPQLPAVISVNWTFSIQCEGQKIGVFYFSVSRVWKNMDGAIFFLCMLIHKGLCVQQPRCYAMICPHHNMHLPILPAFLISLAIKVWADLFWQLTICKTGSTGLAGISHFSWLSLLMSESL